MSLVSRPIDVGFGYERMLQAMEGKTRIEATELFDQSLDPISRDHVRTLTVFHQQGITPGNRAPNSECGFYAVAFVLSRKLMADS